ncbi:MAG: ribosome small subunit-dependent GTPase A [Acidimicrobiales bacterium]|nr:ribosome small subunit-dependent GTPase A [Acidimicrobiales bacterium]
MTSSPLVTHGWNDRWAALFDLAVASLDRPPQRRPVPGRVVRHDGVALTLALPDGIRSLGLSRQLEPAPTVGDWVVVDDDVPVAVLERTSLLVRRSPRSDTPQLLAANVDGVLVVCGLDRPISSGRIDRVITLAWEAGATPAVVLTKADLVDDAAASVGAVETEHPGVDVVTTSAVDATGLDDVHALVAGRTVVLVGESGAGKSTLANALLGAQVMATGDVRAGDAKGRHTTTTREAHPLPGGGVLIDTPGLRTVGLWADRDAVAATFSDVDDLAAECRFNDCGHAGEPGCAVRAAVDAGTLAPERFAAWQELEREAAAAELRAVPHLARARDRRLGRIGRQAQRRKGRPDS